MLYGRIYTIFNSRQFIANYLLYPLTNKTLNFSISILLHRIAIATFVVCRIVFFVAIAVLDEGYLGTSYNTKQI